MVGLPLGGPACLSTWVAPLFGLPVGRDVGILVGRQHLGGWPTRVVGLSLGGPARFFPHVALPFGLPIGPKLSFLIGFTAIAEGCLGRHLAVTRGCQGHPLVGVIAEGCQHPLHNYGAQEPRGCSPCHIAGHNSESKSCRSCNVLVRVTIVVLLLARKLVSTCKGGFGPARAIDNLDGDAAPAKDGSSGDAAPALRGHLGQSCFGGLIGWVVRVLPRLGLTSHNHGAAASRGGPCLATGPPDACALIVVRVVLGNGFGLDVIQVILGDGFGLDVAPTLGVGERVGMEEGRGLFALCPFVGTRCPACKLRLTNPAVELDCAPGVSTPGRPEVV